MTLRLDDTLADDLELVARVDGHPMADVVRQALADHVAARRSDPGFRAALRAQLARLRQMLGEDAALWPLPRNWAARPGRRSKRSPRSGAIGAC